MGACYLQQLILIIIIEVHQTKIHSFFGVLVCMVILSSESGDEEEEVRRSILDGRRPRDESPNSRKERKKAFREEKSAKRKEKVKKHIKKRKEKVAKTKK